MGGGARLGKLSRERESFLVAEVYEIFQRLSKRDLFFVDTDAIEAGYAGRKYYTISLKFP